MTVTLTKVSKQYGSVHALDGVSFQLERGITGLLGPNGAGRQPCSAARPPGSLQMRGRSI